MEYLDLFSPEDVEIEEHNGPVSFPDTVAYHTAFALISRYIEEPEFVSEYCAVYYEHKDTLQLLGTWADRLGFDRDNPTLWNYAERVAEWGQPSLFPKPRHSNPDIDKPIPKGALEPYLTQLNDFVGRWGLKNKSDGPQWTLASLLRGHLPPDNSTTYVVANRKDEGRIITNLLANVYVPPTAYPMPEKCSFQAPEWDAFRYNRKEMESAILKEVHRQMDSYTKALRRQGWYVVPKQGKTPVGFDSKAEAVYRAQALLETPAFIAPHAFLGRTTVRDSLQEVLILLNLEPRKSVPKSPGKPKRY